MKWNNSETMSHIWTFRLVFIDTRILRYPNKYINMQMHTCKHGHEHKYTHRHNHLHRRISLLICLQQIADSTIPRGVEVQQWCLLKLYPMTDRKKIYNQKSILTSAWAKFVRKLVKKKHVKGQFNTWIKINEKYNEEVIYNFAVLLLHFDVGNLQQKQWE